MSRPSDGMTLDELRDEFDWMFEFQSRMAERIRQDADVHSLVDYVTGLEAENRKLRAMRDTWAENDAKLRELVRFIMHQCNDGNPRCDECIGWNDGECVALLRMREMGVEVY